MSLDFDIPEEEQPKQSNRTFTIIAGILAAVILLALVVIAVLVIFITPGSNDAKFKEAAAINAQNTAVVMQATSAAMTAMAPTATPIPPTATATSTPLPPTSTPTQEPVLPVETVQVAELSLNDQLTATVSALLTQASSSKGTPLPGTEATIDPNATIVAQPSALPNTGFADEVGLPGLVGLTIILLAVILFTRRARAARSG